MAKVILDPSHGGRDPGDFYGNRAEKNDNLQLALAVGDILQENGIEVVYTRISDDYVTQIDRVKIANEEGGDLLVSFGRIDGDPLGPVLGLNFYLYTEGGLAEDAANQIGTNLTRIEPVNYGVLIRTDLPIISRTEMPALLMEMGYIRSEEDNLIYDTNFENIAEAVAIGIMETLGIAVEEFQPSKSKKDNDNYEPRYQVQVGLFSVYNNALNLQMQLIQEGYQANIVPRDNYYAVQVGNYENLDEAAALEIKLRMQGYDTQLIAE